MVNVSPLVDTIINWVKPFIKEKIRNRIHVHSDLESLHKFVPKDILPEEYGGSAGKLQTFHGKWRWYHSYLNKCIKYNIFYEKKFVMGRKRHTTHSMSFLLKKNVFKLKYIQPNLCTNASSTSLSALVSKMRYDKVITCSSVWPWLNCNSYVKY